MGELVVQAGAVDVPITLTLLRPGGEPYPLAGQQVELVLGRPWGLAPLVLRAEDGVTVAEDAAGRPCLLYRTEAGDLPVEGAYEAQGFILGSDGTRLLPSVVVHFKVLRNVRGHTLTEAP